MENGYLDLVDTIKTLNQQTLKKWDQTALCEIVTKNNDGTYNIRMLSDEGENGSIIPNVRNGSKYSFKEGDQGVLFKYKNQITMSFLVFKIGGEEQDSSASVEVVSEPAISTSNVLTPNWVTVNTVSTNNSTTFTLPSPGVYTYRINYEYQTGPCAYINSGTGGLLFYDNRSGVSGQYDVIFNSLVGATIYSNGYVNVYKINNVNAANITKFGHSYYQLTISSMTN